MIDFPCLSCGRRFSVPDEQAGRDFQCPACGNLVGVPSAADLAGLNADGTLMVAPAAPRPDSAARFAELRRTFTPTTLDDDGNEIDNRTLADAVELAPIPGADRSPPPPRYDPETGELLTPFGIAPMAVLPVTPSAGPPLGYRRPGRAAVVAAADARRVSAAEVWRELFRPVNVGVMGLIFAGHFLLNVSFLVVNAGLLFFVLAPLVMFLVLLGHYGNVVDEVATGDRDELPAPLRSLSWSDDLWGPFRDDFFITMLVFGPLIAAGVLSSAIGFGSAVLLPLAALASVGVLLFVPALLLTLRTSGSVFNLRPDRVWGTIRACGPDYYPVAAIGLIAVPAAAAGFVVSLYWWLAEMGIGVFGDWGVLNNFAVAHLVLLVGIYLGHAFAWRVGLLYRSHRAAIPWVNQEAIRGGRAVPRPPVRPAARTTAAPPLPPGTRPRVQSSRHSSGGPAACSTSPATPVASRTRSPTAAPAATSSASTAASS